MNRAPETYEDLCDMLSVILGGNTAQCANLFTYIMDTFKTLNPEYSKAIMPNVAVLLAAYIDHQRGVGA